MYFLQNIVRMIRSRRMRSLGHVAGVEEVRNAYNILIGKPEGKRLGEEEGVILKWMLRHGCSGRFRRRLTKSGLQLAKEYNLRLSTKKTKVLLFKGVEHLRAKIEISNQILEQVTCFNCLGCNISC
jgi:hypothetical protein